MFTQPVDDQILIFPSEVLVQYLTSPTDVLIEVELPVTSPTLQFEMEIIYMKNMQEPCLVNGACESTTEQGSIDSISTHNYVTTSKAPNLYHLGCFA